MQKKTNSKNSIPFHQNIQERETKILNVICNTSFLLVSIMTEAFNDIFTKMSKEMITTITTGLGAPNDTIKEINGGADNIQKELPKQMREQLLAMKIDIITQLEEKKDELATIIADKRFDEGIAIVERYKFSLPKLNCDLDERSLFGYITLLKENDEQFNKMFQELLEWMKNLPQP
jgi:uncharacterized protein YdcH (DUF465 family)